MIARDIINHIQQSGDIQTRVLQWIHRYVIGFTVECRRFHMKYPFLLYTFADGSKLRIYDNGAIAEECHVASTNLPTHDANHIKHALLAHHAISITVDGKLYTLDSVLGA